ANVKLVYWHQRPLTHQMFFLYYFNHFPALQMKALPPPPTPPPPPAITRTCLRDAAYERLRDWILDGTLAPEEPLRDEALAEALGMSRTPVREALQRLEDDGLVITSATRRSYVSPLSVQQARDVFPMVAALEVLS